MNKIALFGIVLIICLLLGTGDFILNGYQQKISFYAVGSGENKKDDVLLKEKITALAPQLKLIKEKKRTTLFNLFNPAETDFITESESLLFAKNNQNILTFYVFTFKNQNYLEHYLKFKELFQTIQKQNIEINEVNNYGLKSFYVNFIGENNVGANPQISKLMILTADNLVAVEYLNTEEYSAEIKPLLQKLFNSNHPNQPL